MSLLPSYPTLPSIGSLKKFWVSFTSLRTCLCNKQIRHCSQLLARCCCEVSWTWRQALQFYSEHSPRIQKPLTHSGMDPSRHDDTSDQKYSDIFRTHVTARRTCQRPNNPSRAPSTGQKVVEGRAVAVTDVQEGARACESETDGSPSRGELRWESVGPTKPFSGPLLRHVDQHRSFSDGSRSRLPGPGRPGGMWEALPTLIK